MKKLTLVLLYFCTLLLPASASATLFTYDIALTILAASLQQPLYGDVRIASFFTQDTGRDLPYSAFDSSPDLRPRYGINQSASQSSMFWSVSAFNPNDIKIAINDYAGYLIVDLLYDHMLALNAPFREPDHIAVSFGYELGWLCAPLGPCTLGTGGSQTFDRGEFSFARDHAEVPEPTPMLLAGGGLICLAILLRRRGDS